MSQPFDVYAKFYDLMYREKDYKGEAAYIAGLIKENARPGARAWKVLDLACGTGKHAFALNDLGFDMQGSDISPKMIAIAKESARIQKRNVLFHNESFQTADRLQGGFDAVISMFSAIDYVTRQEELITTLQNIRGLLNEEGLFVFDYWNASAVVSSFSPVRVLRKKNEQGELLRVSETTIDPIAQVATIHYTCLYWAEGQRTEFEETHHMRYHSFTEMDLLLRTQGFEIIRRCPFLEPDKEVQPEDWNISIVAQKVKDQ